MTKPAPVAALAALAVLALAGLAGLPRVTAQDGPAGSALNQPPLLDFIPTYERDVRPILQARCVACHQEGGIAPFSLEDSQAAVARAGAISVATRERHMPPWLPAPDSPHFVGERRLSDHEIAVLTNWYWAGAPLGKASQQTAAAKPASRPQPDLTVDAGRDFTPSDALPDEYRCFIIDPKLERERWLAGYDITPGASRIVHHVLLFQVSGKALAEARALEAKSDGRGGYTCFGGINVGMSVGERIKTRNNEPSPDVGYIGSWTPGSSQVTFPAGAGVLLKPGAQFVMQVHYNTLAGVTPDRTAAKLYFAPEGTSLKPIKLATLIAPVEIPCAGRIPSDDKDRCSREAAYAAVRTYQEAALTDVLRAGLLLNYCHQALTAASDGTTTTSCDFPVSADRLVLGVQGHMHLLGSAVRIDLNPGKANARLLLDIPKWDFHWQGGYWLTEPIPMNKGDTLRITCSYDNRPEAQPWLQDGQAQPRYVVWGEGTTDEMCLGAVLAINR